MGCVEGDSEFDAMFTDWRDLNGAKWPGRVQTLLQGMRVHDIRFSNVTADPALAANQFAIPQAQLAMAARPADPRITPFQWIIRRSVTGSITTRRDVCG